MDDMLIIHVSIQIKPECADAFRHATLENARNSLQEAGIARFDVLRDQSDPAHFVLLEAYHDPAAHARHRETAHYAIWRDTVADMMAAPRVGTKYDNLFPDDGGW